MEVLSHAHGVLVMANSQAVVPKGRRCLKVSLALRSSHPAAVFTSRLGWGRGQCLTSRHFLGTGPMFNLPAFPRVGVVYW